MKRWLEPFLIFGGVAIAHLLVVNHFGVTMDEPIRRVISEQFARFLQTGDTTFLQGIDATDPLYGAAYHVLYSPWFPELNLLLSNGLLALGVPFVAANHVLTILSFALCAALVFAFARAIADRRTAFVSTMVFVLLPHLVAHAQYNPKDIPLMAAVTAATFAFHHLLVARTKASAIVAGLLLAVVVGIKMSGFAVVAIYLATYAIVTVADRAARTRRALARDAVLAGVAALAFVLTMPVLWPSVWFDPLLPFRTISFLQRDFFDTKILYFGTAYDGSALPWHYTLVSLLFSLPLPTLALFLAGMAIAAGRTRDRGARTTNVLLLCWIAVPLLLSMKPGLFRYDGFRQFFFTLPAVAIVAGIALERLAAWIGTHAASARTLALPALCVVFAAWVGSEIIAVHPYEGSYANQIERAIYPADIERSMEFEYWGSSYKEGLAWLDTHAEPNAILCVPTAGQMLLWYPLRTDYLFNCEDPDYLMFFTRTPPPVPPGLTPVFEIRRYGSRLLAIYRLKN